jgi:hypothetical protein
MATLLLTAVGSAIGGPIGAAIGAMAGQRVDQALLGPKGRQGARLADLAVQASTYGASIPRLYGRMRVSGTVIWATDLREERQKVSQGKGRPNATVYSYSASFAVLLSARPIRGIGRIWADGTLLRGAAGDFKIETGFRFHSGAPDQPVDPLIASAEGAAAPAYRGRAYAVFEDMALESFGNRIPNLSFEVLADDGPVAVVDIIADLAGGDVDAAYSRTLDGYVADGSSVAAALAPLNDIAALDWTDRGTALHVGRSDFPNTVVAEEDLGAAIDLNGGPRLHQKRGAADSLPSRLELAFADPSRDYQLGLQSIDLHANGQEQHIDLPAALDADHAAQWARERLFAARRETMVVEVRLPWRYLSGWSAASLSLQGQPWRVRSVAMEGLSVVVTLSPRTALPSATVPVDGGRIVAEADRAAGRTTLRLADLPSVQDAAATAPLVVAAAAGTTPGWRSAVLMQRAGPTAPWEDLGRTAAPATMGMVRNPLGAASPHLMDMRNTLTVDLLHDGMSLLNVSDDALWTGANLALVGGEVLQFGMAERFAPGRWILSRLLRGRRGTEARIADHAAQEPFLLLDPETLTALSVPTGASDVDVLAKGVGDPDGVTASLSAVGAALRPLSPVHLRAVPLSDGTIDVQWTRRSREGWRWLDGIEVPVAEEAELYRIEIAALPLAESIGATLAQPHYQLSAGQLAELRSAGATSLTLSVRQIGRFVQSDPATTAFPL